MRAQATAQIITPTHWAAPRIIQPVAGPLAARIAMPQPRTTPQMLRWLVGGGLVVNAGLWLGIVCAVRGLI